MNALKAMDAMNAYGATLGMAGAGKGQAAATAKSATTKTASFEALLKDTTNAVSDAARSSERASISGLNGNMNLVDVVTAVSNAEMMIDTVVAVRDKVIQSYQEIMRMPI